MGESETHEIHYDDRAEYPSDTLKSGPEISGPHAIWSSVQNGLVVKSIGVNHP
jgi:hypothetical protein